MFGNGCPAGLANGSMLRDDGARREGLREGSTLGAILLANQVDAMAPDPGRGQTAVAKEYRSGDGGGEGLAGAVPASAVSRLVLLMI